MNATLAEELKQVRESLCEDHQYEAASIVRKAEEMAKWTTAGMKADIAALPTPSAWQDVDSAIKSAVDAERDRCYRIAFSHRSLLMCGVRTEAITETAMAIAAAIADKNTPSPDLV